MKKEVRVLKISIINNFLITIIKILGGVFGKCNSLLADGLHTFSDFITDIMAIFGTKISKKKPNKTHPFGYGNAEYITNLFIGAIIFVLGVFIIISSFLKKAYEPSMWLVIIICLTVLMKLYSALNLLVTGKKLKSNILITSSKESFTDVYSSIMVLIIIILSNFQTQVPLLKYADLVGSIVIGVLVLVTSIKLIKANVLGLIGEVIIDEEKYNKVINVLKNFKNIEVEKLEFLSYGPFYKAIIKIKVDPNISVKKLLKLENNINKKIKSMHLKLNYITIDII